MAELICSVLNYWDRKEKGIVCLNFWCPCNTCVNLAAMMKSIQDFDKSFDLNVYMLDIIYIIIRLCEQQQQPSIFMNNSIS